MNFQQLRSVREAARRGFNLTEVAEVLHTSQPGVSRQIREIEAELGVTIFTRSGKRLTGLTGPGEMVLPIIERLLVQAENLQRASEDFARAGQGVLTVATTHSQARYALPPVVRDFRAMHPGVRLQLHQGTPRQIAQLLIAGEAEIGIASEALATYDALLALPCYRWTHHVIVPSGHPLALESQAGEQLTLQRLAQCPLITYETGYTGRSQINEAFAATGLTPDVVLEAMDADVIKTYVELGMGVGIVAAIAIDEGRDTHLQVIDARDLFPPTTTRLAIKRGVFLRDYVYDFIATFAPPLTRRVVDEALLAPGEAQP